MRKPNATVALALLFQLSMVPVVHALSAMEILKKADAIRMPKGDTEISATVVSKVGDVEKSKATYEVLMRGSDNTVIKTLSPATDRGTSTLMLKRDLWIFLPDVAKPVRVSLQQRLMGEVSNGDLARVNFVGDYTPTIAKNTNTFYELNLAAVSDDVTYAQVRLWVDKKTLRPIKAAFYAASGRVLKVGNYLDYRPMAGVTRPSKLLFVDAVDKTKQSTIYYNSIRSTTFPDKTFTKDHLKKLKY